MKVQLTIERTTSGVRLIATGDYQDIIETTIVPRERIGMYVVDLLLDRVYLKGACITVNDAVAFEAFDAERDYADFIRLIDAAPEPGT